MSLEYCVASLITEFGNAYGKTTKEVGLHYHPWAISFFFDSIRYRYDMRVFFSIRYDNNTILGPQKRPFFKEFSANFQNFRGIFGVLGVVVVVVVVVEGFGSWVFRIFGEFSKFSENFRRKKTKKSLVLRISRYSIWEVQYDILFDILKSQIYRHSIISRYDMPNPVHYLFVVV